MNEIHALLRLELRSLYGINRYRYTKDQKAKNRYRALGLAWVLIIAVVFSYVGGLVWGLCTLGLSEIVPAYLAVIASLLILAFGLFKAGERIFGKKGYDILASMPVRSSSIVLSRFLAMYAEDLLLTLAVMIPGMAVYCICQRPGFGFYPMALLAAVMIPAIPLVISTLLGTLILAVSSRVKRKSMVQSVLMVLLVVGILLGSFGMGNAAESFSLEQFSGLVQTLSSLFERVYPPAMWVNEALVGMDLLSLGLFIFASAGVMVLAVWLTAKNFHGIVRRLFSFSAKHDYKIGKLESRSLLKALYVREAKRYFSSSIYVTNTIIGPIMGTVMSIALCVVGLDAIQSALPLDVDLSHVLPFVMAAVFCMMTTTSTAISMEGKQVWAIKSLPIPTKTLLDSKILLNLSLMLPFYGVSVAAMAIAVKADVPELLWLMLIPGSIMLWAVVFGITVNLKSHRFDWEKEETVVKQSLSAAVGGFGGFLVSLALGGSIFLIPARFLTLAKGLVCLVMLALTVFLYRRNNRANLSDL